MAKIMAKQELKYYKGEKNNPFEEINEKQGAYAMRYNQLASLLWFFEYYWQHGWAGYKKLEDRLECYFFEAIPKPQEEFESLEDALAAFSSYNGTGWLHGCKDWAVYVYENALHERFYKPQCQIVPKDDVPKYLLYWDGSTWNKWRAQSTTKGSGRSMWWNFEAGWYRMTPKELRTEANWRQQLEEYLMRDSQHHPKSEEYQQELKQQLERYKSWRE